MNRYRLIHNSTTRSKVKAYLHIVTGAPPNDAMVDRFVTSFHFLGQLLNDITLEESVLGVDSNRSSNSSRPSIIASQDS
jgi:hypothetical protein